MPIILYLWWLLSNGMIAYFCIDFFLHTTQAGGRKHIPILLAMTTVLTAITTRLQIPGTFWLEIPFWMVYAVVFIKIRWVDLLAPMAILFTLRTFLEGFTVVVTAYTAANLHLSSDGIWMQIFLSLCLDLAFLLILWLMQKRFAFSLQKDISSYLYALLLPCALMVLAVRYGLQLDRPNFAQYLFSWKWDVYLTALFLMTSTAIVFFIMVEIFCKVIQLVEQETTMALLKSQVAGQQIYLEEAKTRNECYAAFQHDIKNHLLVLSSLLQETKYDAAKQYATKLQASCKSFTLPISTGNLILDTLLKEKLSHAQRSGIQVDCQMHIPTSFHAEDLDLCIVFSNILDNAMAACMQVEPAQRMLHIATKVRANFLVIESTNPVTTNKPIEKGIGLKNVEKIAQKYQGITEIENTDGIFKISVLLCSLKSTNDP